MTVCLGRNVRLSVGHDVSRQQLRKFLTEVYGSVYVDPLVKLQDSATANIAFRTAWPTPKVAVDLRIVFTSAAN